MSKHNIYMIEEAIKKAKTVQKEGPLSLRRSAVEAATFPLEALPKVMREAVQGLHDIYQAPIGLCAHSIMAATNLAVQGHANIKLPTGRIRPISCYFLTIAESGERKTSCDEEALIAIEEHEKTLKEKYINEVRNWEDECAVWELEQKCLSKKLSKEEKVKAYRGLGKKPAPPLKYALTYSEPTLEGLFKLFTTGQPSIGIFSSEGGQFLNGHSMREENKIRTAGALCDLWDGTIIKRARSTEELEPLEGKRLAIHLMIQPQIANQFLSDPQLLNQGLLSRLLIASPISTIGTRTRTQVNPLSYKLLQDFHDTVKNILNTPLNIMEGSKNILKPFVIKLSEESKVMYFNFILEVEVELKEGKKYESIKSFASKLGEHALRLAAMFTLVEGVSTNILDRKHMESGITVAKYYALEALRLYSNHCEVEADLLLAEKLINLLHNNWKEEYISLPDIYQKTLHAINTKDKALKIVKILEDHGWLEKIEGKMLVKGKIRQKVWKIIKQ